MEEKKYYYTYERLHKELNISLSIAYDRFSTETELSILCKRYLHNELIGQYEEVEWNRLGINVKTVEQIAKMIDNAFESLRVLVYWRDHADEVLGVCVPEDVKKFERSCCKEITRLRNDFYMANRRIIGNNGTVCALYATRIMKCEDKVQVTPSMLMTMGHGFQMLARYLPAYTEDYDHSPFSAFVVLDVSKRQLPHIIASWEEDVCFSCYDFVYQVQRDLRKLTNRYVPENSMTIIQILFTISVLLETEYALCVGDRNNKLAYHFLGLELLDFMKQRHQWRLEWQNLRDDAIAVLSTMPAMEFDGDVPMNNETSIPNQSAIINENPNTSIFRSDVDAQLCKEKLLDILNHNTCKAEVYRELKDLHDKNLYFNIGTKYAPLARVLNTWIPLTIHKDDKKWIFRGDDFSKTRYS